MPRTAIPPRKQFSAWQFLRVLRVLRVKSLARSLQKRHGPGTPKCPEAVSHSLGVSTPPHDD